MKRGRKGTEVTCVELQWLIEELEGETMFPNRSALWDAVEKSEFAKTRKPGPLSGQTAMMMAKKYNLQIQTPIGQRGRQKGCAPVVRTGKKKEIPAIAAESMRILFPLKMKTVDKAISGSFKAAVKLKCLDCACGVAKEIRLCPITACPLWAFRPYKKKKVS